MAVVMVINLYLVRLVLHLLGTEDYGIYNVVAGVITMLSSVTIVLSTSVQRFYSYSIGEHNDKKIRQVYSCSLNIFIVLALLIVLIGETFGLWYINNHLNIPSNRFIAARWVYQFSVFTFVLSMIKTPFSALTIANEDMTIYSIITISEVLLKVSLVILAGLINADKLILYGALLLLVCLVDCLAYIIIAKRKYKYCCSYSKIENQSLYKEILSFSGWTFWGTIAGVGMNQFNTILTNVFFGPIVNAARAISLQVSSAISTFTNSLVLAIRPPMVKSYAEGNLSFVFSVFNISNKIIIYLLSIVSIPLIIEMDYILNLWLGVTDSQTIAFTRLMIIYSVVLALHNPITIIIQATGHIKWYNILVESLTLLCVPLTYLMFKLDFPAVSTYFIMIFLIVLAHLVRLVCLKKLFSVFTIKGYVFKLIIPAAIVYCITFVVSYYLHSLLNKGFFRLICVTLVSVIIIAVLAYCIALSNEEKNTIIRYIRKK